LAEGDESDGTIRCFHPEHILVLISNRKHLDFYEDLTEIEGVFSSINRPNLRPKFFSAPTTRLRRGFVSPTARFPMDLARSVDFDAGCFTAGFFLGLFCFPTGSKTGRSATECSGPAQCPERRWIIALATELGIPFEKIAKALPNFGTRAGVSKSNMASDRFLLVDDLCASSNRNSGHPRRRAFDWAQSRADNVSAASLHPNQGIATGIWRCLRSGRSRCYHRRLSGERAAHSRDQRANHWPTPFSAHGHRGVTYHRVSLTSITTSATCWRRAISSLVSAREIFTSNYRFWRRSWWSRKIKGIVGEEGGVRFARANGETHYLARGRSGSVLDRAAHGEKLLRADSFLSTRKIFRSLSSDAARIFWSRWRNHRCGRSSVWGEFDEYRGELETRSRPVLALKLKQVAYAGRDAGIGGLEGWKDSGRGRRRIGE